MNFDLRRQLHEMLNLFSGKNKKKIFENDVCLSHLFRENKDSHLM